MEVKVTRANQVTIPKQIVEKLGISRGDKLIVTLEDGKIVLYPKKKNKPKIYRLNKRINWKIAEQEIEEEIGEICK